MAGLKQGVVVTAEGRRADQMDEQCIGFLFFFWAGKVDVVDSKLHVIYVRIGHRSEVEE